VLVLYIRHYRKYGAECRGRGGHKNDQRHNEHGGRKVFRNIGKVVQYALIGSGGNNSFYVCQQLHFLGVKAAQHGGNADEQWEQSENKIIGELRRYLRDNNSIRVSRSLRDTAYKALSARERLTALHQKEPSIMEIATELSMPKEDVVLALDSIQEPLSLFEPVFHDDGDAIYVMDQVKDTKNTDTRWIENLSLSEAMKKLTDREQKILQMRFFDGKTQMEVADEIGISQAQVSRLEKNALKFMKKYVQ